MPDESPPSQPLLLTDASVQEIMLELIRRRRFNAFNGPRVVASLRAHGDLWTAALLRTDGLPPRGANRLGVHSLMNLRDIPDNRWNGDALYCMCPNADQAKQLAQVAIDEKWKADAFEVYEPSAEVDSALGTAEPAAIVEWWWD